MRHTNLFFSHHHPKSHQRSTALPLHALFYHKGYVLPSINEALQVQPKNLVVMAHGLLGSSRSLESTARKLSAKFPSSTLDNYENNDTILACIDMRNHGNSPHSSHYQAFHIAHDIEKFVADFIHPHNIDKHPDQHHHHSSVENVALIGHSYGGSAIVGALSHMAISHRTQCLEQKFHHESPMLEKYTKAAVIVDICPGCRPDAAISSVEKIFDTMNSVEFDEHSSYSTTERALREGIPSTGLRQFVLTNFAPKNSTTPMPKWRCNFPVLYHGVKSREMFVSPVEHFQQVKKGDCVSLLAEDENAEKVKSEVPALFVFGGKSEYNNKEGRKRIPQYFADVQQVEIAGAGHYVHVEKQEEFVKVTTDFLNSKLV